MQALVYAGSPIGERDEFLCLTDMWRAAGADDSKRPRDWLSQSATREFIGHVSMLINASADGIIVTERGRTGGTWAHWQIGLAYAKYLSPEFHAWGNEVIRTHMEGRGLPVQAAQGAITLSEEALERFADRIGEGAVRAAREFLSEDVKQTFEPRFDRIDKRLETIEQRAFGRRRNLTAETKREHIDAVWALGGRCPCCGTATVVGDSGAHMGEFDHYYASNYPDADHTWLICKSCHSTAGKVARDERDAVFKAYQDKRRNLPGRQGKLFG